MRAWDTDRIREASNVRPSARQLAWQSLEFYGFVHFGMNSMTDREWGHGGEDPALFDPSDLDADQWVQSIARAGMRGLILTAKHHDGFCLWPSAFTEHTVAASPWRGGAGDLVEEVSTACERHGLRFGIYLSPWDRTEPSYGSGAEYDEFFVNQLTEVCTRYGRLFSVWLDGACGEGPNGKVQVYDWDRYFRVVRELQPDAVISVCGPDVRWCGNEGGHTRRNEWSVVPDSLREAERTAALSQHVDDPSFSKIVPSVLEDLGSREALMSNDQTLVWYPAEVNTSIRPGWFHHPEEDGAVRTADELFDLWRRSVGGNSTLLLNVPPTKDGLVHPRDEEVLDDLGRRIDAFLSREITAFAHTSSASGPGSLWIPDEDEDRPSSTITWDEPFRLEAVVLEEQIAWGQQVDSLQIDGVDANGGVHDLGRVQSIGYRRIVPLDGVVVVALRVHVLEKRGPVRLRVRVMGQRSGAVGL